MIFDKLIVPTIEKGAEYIAVRFIYIYALPYKGLMDNYEKYGFRRLRGPVEEELHKRLKPIYDRGCIFMYQGLNEAKNKNI